MWPYIRDFFTDKVAFESSIRGSIGAIRMILIGIAALVQQGILPTGIEGGGTWIAAGLAAVAAGLKAGDPNVSVSRQLAVDVADREATEKAGR